MRLQPLGHPDQLRPVRLEEVDASPEARQQSPITLLVLWRGVQAPQIVQSGVDAREASLDAGLRVRVGVRLRLTAQLAADVVRTKAERNLRQAVRAAAPRPPAPARRAQHTPHE